ncbi:MAG: penicillin acylase family protein [Anaerolineales bacterium]
MPNFADLLAPLAETGLRWLSRRRLPRLDGTLPLSGLLAPVEILWDRWGVPHIYAENFHDLLLGQGYVHAQERLFQMDFNRRAASGRLAEVVGERALPMDRWMRTLTLRRVAETEVGRLSPATRKALEAYAAGVNAFIARGPLPVEFTLLRYRPEPWSATDTLCWIKMMAWELGVNWESELLRARLLQRLGPADAAALDAQDPERWPAVLPEGVDYGALGDLALRRAGAAHPFIGPAPPSGSNNWAVAGARTTTGKPLLANDMHLLMNVPAIWFENHLAAGDFEVTGITFPGIPGVVAGHNGHVAWGFTNSYVDVQDLYVERLHHTEDGRIQARYGDGWYDVTVLHESIEVRGGETVVEELLVTRHGPIINCLTPEGEAPLALRWTALEPDNMIEALFEMNRARTCSDFHQALRHWTAPAQHVVYADTAGDIGYTLAGRVPVRHRGDGRLPVPGWTADYDWEGYIPFEALPHRLNPPEGYLATANNAVVEGDYSYPIYQETAVAERAERIVELLESRERADVPFFRRMHFDRVSHSARIVAQQLCGLTVDDPELSSVMALLEAWDGTLDPDSGAAAVEQVFVRTLLALLLEPRLKSESDDEPKQLERAVFGLPPVDLFVHYLHRGDAFKWLLKLLEQPHSHWYDLGQGEGREEVCRRALEETVAYLKRRLGPEVSHWRWGDLHALTYRHSLGAVPWLGKIFNRGPYPVGGDATTVWAIWSSLRELSSPAVVGPPYRMIVDLGDLRNSLGLLAPGQSGRLASPHYDDQIEAWFTGDYHPLLFVREDVEGAAEHRLQMKPVSAFVP